MFVLLVNMPNEFNESDLKTKFDQFNCGVNADFSVKFGFRPEITHEYGLRPCNSV